MSLTFVVTSTKYKLLTIVSVHFYFKSLKLQCNKKNLKSKILRKAKVFKDSTGLKIKFKYLF